MGCVRHLHKKIFDRRLKWRIRVAALVCDPATKKTGSLVDPAQSLDFFTEDFGVGLERNLVASVVKEVMIILKEPSEETMEEYQKNSIVLGKEIRYIQNGVSNVGVATHINQHGHLYVRDTQGDTKILSSGEISVKFN